MRPKSQPGAGVRGQDIRCVAPAGPAGPVLDAAGTPPRRAVPCASVRTWLMKTFAHEQTLSLGTASPRADRR